MKHKTLLPIIFFCLSLSARSQEKFIEVTVSDTVWITPNQFVYTIVAKPFSESGATDTTTDYSAAATEKRMRDYQQKQKLLIDSLKEVIGQKGFITVMPHIENRYSTYDEIGFNTLEVFTTTADSINILYNLVANTTQFGGMATTIKSTDEGKHVKRLYQKLVDEAKGKAAAIAGVSNLKVGRIISVKEEPSESGWTAYPPLSELARCTVPGWHTTIYPGQNMSTKATGQYQVKNTFVVRFAVE